MPTALIMCISDPSGDPRPRRAVELLTATGYRVEALSLAATGRIAIAEYHQLPPPTVGLFAAAARKLRTFAGLLLSRLVPMDAVRDFVVQSRFGTSNLRRRLAGRAYDLILVEDVQLLPAAFSIRGDARIVFDAREYYARQDEGDFWFEFVHRSEQAWLCRTFMPRCSAVITVSPGLADEYAREFGVRPAVVRSVPAQQDLPVNSPEPEAIRIVHHGIAKPNRKLHQLIDIVAALDARFTLDLYLTGDAGYINELKAHAASLPRVRFMPPVSFERICTMLNGYDIGMLFYTNENFNQVHCLPNKLFEYIQARIAVAISPSPDMTDIVRTWDCGIVAGTFEPASIVPQLAALTPERLLALKRGSDAAAAELNWAIESEKLYPILCGSGAPHRDS